MSSERQAINKQSPWWGEHVHRYDEVIKELNNHDKILDIACGTGFGSDLLAAKTKGEVIGGDIDKEAILECQGRWDKYNLQFKVLDGTNLDFDDQYFDKVVSFETIEHTTKYKEMLAEFARVLKPNGIAFISTPNFPINSPTGVVTNPYHTQEFVYNELKQILEEAFSSVVIYGQKYIRYDTGGNGTNAGKIVESILYQRGVRKLPISFQDTIMNAISGNPMYPKRDDYEMVTELPSINKCKTFFAVCKKSKT